MRRANKHTSDPGDDLRDRIYILGALDAALTRWPEVSAVAYACDSSDALVDGLRDLLGIDEVQATAVMDMQTRRVTRLERQRIADQLAEETAALQDLERD